MSNLWMTLFFCLCCFIWGFAQSYDSWKERAIDGKPFEIKGKVYKIVELNVIEKRGDDASS